MENSKSRGFSISQFNSGYKNINDLQLKERYSNKKNFELAIPYKLDIESELTSIKENFQAIESEVVTVNELLIFKIFIVFT